MSGGPELEAVVDAVVRALIARRRPAGPVDAEALVQEAVVVLRPLLARLQPAAQRPPDGRVIVERDVLDAEPAGRLVLGPGAVVTPLARDTAAERGVELVREAS
jgi:hypothetical protein